MNHEHCLRVFQKHAASVITADPNGAVMDYSLHGALDQAPIKLLVLVEQSWEGGLQIVGEIGIGKGHPWRANHNFAHLPVRVPEMRASEEYIRGTAATIVETFRQIVAARAARWDEPQFRRPRLRERTSASRKIVEPKIHNGRRVKTWMTLPRGIAASVAEEDEAIHRLFDELEWLNPMLQRRIGGIATHLNALTWAYYSTSRKQRGRQRGIEAGFQLLKRPDNQLLLRPHILGAILGHLKRPGILLDTLHERKVITWDTYAQVVKVMSRPQESALNFRILPPEAEKWDVMNGHGLWVALRKRGRIPAFEVAKPESPIPSTRAISQQHPPPPPPPLDLDALEEPDWVREDLEPDEQTTLDLS